MNWISKIDKNSFFKNRKSRRMIGCGWWNGGELIQMECVNMIIQTKRKQFILLEFIVYSLYQESYSQLSWFIP